jgi:hypothetical protein
VLCSEQRCTWACSHACVLALVQDLQERNRDVDISTLPKPTKKGGFPLPPLCAAAAPLLLSTPSHHVLVSACGRHIINAFGDHVHACKKHTGSRKAAHESILDAIEEICQKAGITTVRRNIPSIKKRNGKMGRGDLVLKHVNLGGHRHLVLDVAVNHEFGGDHLADVSRNGALRDAQPSRILESTARTKVDRYRAGYAALKYAFLTCVISTSGSPPRRVLAPPLHHRPPPHLQLVQAA